MTTSSRKPHSAKRRRLQCAVALAMTCALDSTQGFNVVTLSEHRVLSSQRYFRESRDTKSAGAYIPSDLLGQDFQLQIKQSKSKALWLSTATASQLFEVQSIPTANPMPLWLSKSKGHLFEENWEALQETLKRSFFSSKEASKLLKAIKRAARGDRNKMAGAVEFCQILVETMETDLNTLIAASFHFCSCVAARENSVDPPNGADSFYSWEHQDQFDMQLSFSDTTAFIAKDASRLKKLEVLAVNSDVTTANPADADNLQMLLLTETKDWRALAIRCAACLFRLTGIIRTSPNELTKESIRVAREAFHVYAPLASRLGMHRLKNELEGAAFRVLYRRQFEKVDMLTHEIRPPSSASLSRRGNLGDNEKLDIGESMKHVLLSVQNEMVELLEQDPQFSENVQSFSVTSRVKEPYSVWRKMIRKGTKHILDVPDALALRVVLDAKKKSQDENPLLTKARERALCYYAQNLCTKHWKPLEVDPRFKDYIERPKPNGYQSLHYTAHTEWGGEDWKLEVQVRSGEMHKVAEFGFASHWEYKAQQNSRKFQDRSGGGYLRFLQEWHWRQHAPSVQIEASLKCGAEESNECESKIRADRIRARTKHLEPYLHAFTNAQSDLARERVFVFVFGKLVDLPSGSSIQDALEEADFPIGMPLEFGASEVALILHNGLESGIDTVLRNGDSLTTGFQTSTLRP